MDRYKLNDLKLLDIEVLDIMIKTIEYEIQKVSGNKGFVYSAFSIVVALVVVAIPVDDKTMGVIFSIYIIILLLYTNKSNKQINKLYSYLNTLRFVRMNK